MGILSCRGSSGRAHGWLPRVAGRPRSRRAVWRRPRYAGARLDVEGPIGDFTFPSTPAVDRFIFIAGGTGIAPVRVNAAARVADAASEIVLLYSARTPDEFAYHGELQALANAGRIDMRQTITRSLDPVQWTGRRGGLARTSSPRSFATRRPCASFAGRRR